MSPDQEPKYDAIDGKIVNRHTGVAVPDDEPLFVFRARDIHASKALHHYFLMLASSPVSHQQAVLARIQHFEAFARAHPDRMKEPDTPA